MADLLNFLQASNNTMSVLQIVNINEKSIEYGLSLTSEDAKELICTRDETLRSYGRVEVGSGVLGKIIDTFCDSRYIFKDNYKEILSDLLDTFYYIKNESLDFISDDELIDLMKEFFEYKCHGSIELLQSRYLEQTARCIRFGKDYKEALKEDIIYFDELEDEE